MRIGLLITPLGAFIPSQLVITNIMDVDPEDHVLWDHHMNRPVEFWQGNYSNIKALSCYRSGDLLFDWLVIQQSLAKWLKEMMTGSSRVMQTYWELIRPVQHAFTNIVAFHNITTSRDCMLGMLAVRLFYLTVQSQAYREHEIIEQNNFLIDWHYFTNKFGWADIVRSGWGDVIWPSQHLIASSFADQLPWLSWIDCESPEGLDGLPSSIQDVALSVADSTRIAAIQKAVDAVELINVRKCPVAFAFAAVLVAFQAIDVDIALQYLDRAQDFVRLYREKNDFTLVNLLNIRWPIWYTLALTVDRIADEARIQKPEVCGLLWCPSGGTPNPLTCNCEVLFPANRGNVTACIFMVDTRRKSSLRNITSVLNARYWTLTYGINRLYAEDHGYEIEYVQPDNQTHFPDRKVGWGKVKVIIDKLRAYGPQRCSFGVSIDTDAYIRTSEPLSSAIYHYGLDDSKLILFSQEYHTELRPSKTFINGGFFIVRNTKEGVDLLEEWYNVPEDHIEMAHLKKENPQGLNLCWDEKVQPFRANTVVLAPSHLFTAPLGWFVRHNWFKDLHFEQEMQDVLLQRLYHKYGCIMCQNVYDWDDSLNIDVGWR